MMSEDGKEAPPVQPPVGEDDGQQLRIRKLTPAADDLYEEKVKYYYGKINTYTKTLDSLLLSTELEGSQLTELETTFQNYEEQYKIFSHYLKTVRSDKSTQELMTLEIIYNEYSYKVNKVFEPEVDTKTVISRTSQRSRVSHTSRASNYSQVKAKAEALLASRELIEKEKMLLKEQARIEEARSHMKAESDRKQRELKIELDLLKKEKELYQAQAELKVLEEAEIKSEILSPVKAVKVEKKEVTVKETLSTTHKVKYETVQPTTQTSTHGVDFSKLFLKKELLMQRLRKYDDKPENYQMWKESFKLICTDLGLSPIEEFDLLLKYLGPESVKYAERIYASNAGNPKVGLEMLWKRLYERYGSPELIERALKQKLTKFPRITKDTERLFELSDILHEVSSYMENSKYKTLLSYFNSSVGVLPIVSKLPNFIRTKWISHASRYKVEHDVVSPHSRCL